MMVGDPRAVPPADEGSDTQPRGHPFLLFVLELKQRRVLKTAGFYAFIAWLMIQVADTIVPALELPASLVRLTVIVAFAGFPIAILLAWAFDVTEEGALASAPLIPTSFHDLSRASRLRIATVGILVSLGVAGGWYKFDRGEGRSSGNTGLTPRIAVLYFDDNSPGQNLQYFANGLTESLIDELSRVQALAVASRNSARAFSAGNISPDSVARALAVDYIVSGSVIESTGTIRVLVQLTDSTGEEVIESQTIERPAAEYFVLIDDVVREVATSLRKRLGIEVRIRAWKSAVNNPEAWKLVQQGAQIADEAGALERRGVIAGALRGIASADTLFERATRIDPQWHEPVIQRGWLKQRAAMLHLHGARDLAATAKSLEDGVAFANQVLAADPNHAPAFELRGVLLYFQSLFTKRSPVHADSLQQLAKRDLYTAVRADTLRAKAWSTLSSILNSEGSHAEALMFGERAMRADAYLGNSEATLVNLFQIAFDVQEDQKAMQWCHELRVRNAEFWPAAFCYLMLQNWSPLVQPKLDSARHAYTLAERGTPPQEWAHTTPPLMMLMAGVFARLGQRDSALALIARARQVAAGDPDLLTLEAGARMLLRQDSIARVLLAEYFRQRPHQRSSIARDRRFSRLSL